MGGTVVAVGRKASTASAVLICRLLRGSRVGGTNTGTSVLDWPVGHGELSEVVSDHLWLDFDSGEGLAIVDSDDGSGHLGFNDQFLQWVFTHSGFSIGWQFFLAFLSLLSTASCFLFTPRRNARRGRAQYSIDISSLLMSRSFSRSTPL